MQSNLKLLFNKILIRLTEFKQHKATKLSNARAVSLHRDAPRRHNKTASLFFGCLFPFALDRPAVKIVAETLFVRKVLRSFSFIDFVRSGSKKKNVLRRANVQGDRRQPAALSAASVAGATLAGGDPARLWRSA